MFIAVKMLFALAMILFGAELFTNAIEWFGRKLNLGQGAVGSIFAALGTALPETAVPITAILFGTSQDAKDVGIGGILGAPFLLTTLGCAIMAIALLTLRRRTRGPVLKLSGAGFQRDMSFFLVAYLLTVFVGMVHSEVVHRAAPFVLVLLYIIFLVMTIQDKSVQVDETELKSLYIQLKSGIPALGLVFLQLLVALALIVGGAHLLTGGVTHLARSMQLPAFIVSALLIPLATELPETLNSVVWIRQGKDALAVGNITGAMVFQSTLVPAMGIWLTPWKLTTEALLTSSLTLIAATSVYIAFRKRGALFPGLLLIASLFYWVLPLHALGLQGSYAVIQYFGFGILALLVVVFLRWPSLW